MLRQHPTSRLATHLAPVFPDFHGRPPYLQVLATILRVPTGLHAATIAAKEAELHLARGAYAKAEDATDLPPHLPAP